MAKLLMIGTCPNCGAQVTSRYPFEIGICRCKNPAVEVSLQLAVIPAPRIQKQLRKVAELSGVPVEQLAEELLREVSRAVVRGLEVERRT